MQKSTQTQAAIYVIQTTVNVNALKQIGVNIHVVFYKYTFSYFLFLTSKEMRFNLIFSF